MTDADNSKQLLLRAASASVLVSLLLIALKGAAYWRADSVALLGSLTDSGLDFFASMINLLALRAAFRQPGNKHCPAIIKAQAHAGYALAAVVLAASVYLGWRAFHQLLYPVAIEEGFFGVAVSVFAILASLSLMAYQKNVIDKTASATIATDRLHFLGDIMLNLAVILALLIATGAEIPAADGIFGLGIAAYVAFSAVMIAVNSRDMLKNRETGIMPELKK